MQLVFFPINCGQPTLQTQLIINTVNTVKWQDWAPVCHQWPLSLVLCLSNAAVLQSLPKESPGVLVVSLLVTHTSGKSDFIEQQCRSWLKVALRDFCLWLFVGSCCLLVAGPIAERFWDTLPQIYQECRIFSRFLLGEKQLSDMSLRSKKKFIKKTFLFWHTLLFECLLG